MATTISSGRASSPLLTANIADHGTIYGGRGLIFDGVTDAVQTPSIDLGTTHSVSCWIKTSTGSRIVIGIDTTNYPIYLNSNLQVNYDATGTAVSSADAISSGAWNHVVVTRSGTTVNYYINGKVDSGGADTINSNDSLSGVFALGGISSFYFNGSMSDVKFFDAELTLAQVQELYLKPEQSAPSAVQDNMVAWYPMCEGNPDSPQSIVYDHSEKKLGSNLVANGTDWADSNDDGLADSWSTVYSGEVTTIVTGNGFTGNAQRLGTPGSAWKAIMTSSNIFTANIIYRLSFKYRSFADGGSIDVADGSSGGVSLSDNTGSATEYSINFKGTNGSSLRFRLSDSCGANAYIEIDDVSLKEVLMGNHATTVFHGDELITNGDLESASTSPTMNSVVFTYYDGSGARSTDVDNGGSYSYKFTGGSANDSNARIIPNQSSLVGKTLDISVDVYTASASNTSTGIDLRTVTHAGAAANSGTTSTADKVVNGTFASDANWSKGTGWTIGSGVASCDGSASGNTNLQSAVAPLVVGRKYKVTFDLTRSAGQFRLLIGSSGASDYFNSAGSKTIATIECVGNGHIYCQGDSSFVGTLDNLVIREVDNWQTLTTSNFVYDGTSAQPINLQWWGASSVIYIDNLSIKEVGISSSGFATADSEPTIPQVPLLRYNEKMMFDGFNDYVQQTASLGALDNGSISVWFMLTSLHSTALIIQQYSSGTGYYLQAYVPAAGNLSVRLGTIGAIDTEFDVVVGELYHLAVTWNGSNYYVYVNGVSYTGGSGTAKVAIDSANDLYFGSSDGGSSQFLNGIIDEVSIFNTALSATEVQELFADGVALDATTHSKADYLMGYWRNDGISSWLDRAPERMLFDGSDDHILVSHNNSLSFGDGSSDSAFSTSSWVNMSDATGFRILSKDGGVGSTKREYELMTETSDDYLYLYFRDESASKWSYVKSDATITSYENSWTHIVTTYDGGGGGTAANGIKIYINGSAIAVTANNDAGYVAMENDGGDFYIGRKSGYYADGIIDEVAVWNAELSSGEVTELYNLGLNGNVLTHSNQTNLVSYWKNEGITDALWEDRKGSNDGTVSGSPVLIGGNNGTVQNGTESIIVREGLNSNKDGLGFPFTHSDSNVLRLDGVKDYISIPDSSGLTVKGSFTLEFWYKEESGLTGNRDVIASDDDSNRNFGVRISSGKVFFIVWSGGSAKSIMTDNAVSDGKWKHIACVFTAGTSMTTWVDGVSTKTDTSSVPTTIDDDPTPFKIGTKTTTSEMFKGLLDEIRFYHKALSPAEISKNYKHGKGKHKN
jgi:hypothetical protein